MSDHNQQADAPPANTPATSPTPPAPEAPPAPPANPTSFAPPPEPKAPEPDAETIFEYNPTGDPGLDLALAFIGNLGYGPDNPAVKAAETGDFAPIEAALKAQGDKAKGYERYLAAAKASYAAAAAKNKATEEAAETAIYEAAGGKEAWAAVHAWVSKEASAEQKQQIEAAFRAGTLPAAAMARQLADLYRQSGASKLPPKAVATPTAGAASAASGGALSPAEYKAEIRKLEAKYGYRLQETQEYADITARRRAYRN